MTRFLRPLLLALAAAVLVALAAPRISAQGTNQPLDVELYVEGQTAPVAQLQLKAPEGQQVVPFSGLVFSPQTTGEKRLTLRVKPKEGELVQSNNAVSTYVRVLSGGLGVRYIQGPSSSSAGPTGREAPRAGAGGGPGGEAPARLRLRLLRLRR